MFFIDPLIYFFITFSGSDAWKQADEIDVSLNLE
jgi:hypothetical protein